MSAAETHTNRLIDEASPYLLQHAHNPVDWYPWGPAAMERARHEDKPLLVSIGYAACHWCHVMERESFEDLKTAARMNEEFVCVKVDREERPDVDAIYMDAVQAMTGHGGWPMTVFCEPDGSPFFAGTYYPSEPRHGMPAFRQVLEAVAEAWRSQREQVREQGRRVVDSISRTTMLTQSGELLSEAILRRAFDGVRRQFDREWGGTAGAPKFPQPATWEFVLRCHLRGYDGALEIVTTTLDRMAAGGSHDHVGGGFHRYSVDGRWQVPHFEKMLYDNGQLARLFLHAYQVTGEDRYRRVVLGTLEHLLREMRHPDGGLFSSLDADSEGVEGRFYLWSWEELLEVATAAARGDERVARAVAEYLGALPSGNWDGGNVLWTPKPMREDVLSSEHAEGATALRDAVGSTLRRLRERRESRARPATDDKILAAWNGLAISAFAEAGRVLQTDRYVEAAERAADFVLTRLRRDDGRLLRAWRNGRTGAPAYADDHALMARACLDLYETTFDVRWFEEARGLCDDLIRLFLDADRGGFFQTGSDAEALIVRPKDLFDNAVPSGNSAAADALLRLALFTGEAAYERAGLSALRIVRDAMERAPLGFGDALCTLDLAVGPAREIAVVGEGSARKPLVHEVRSQFRPNTVVAASAAGAADVVPLLRDRLPIDARATAYVCERFVCQRPTTDPDQLREQLGAR